MNEIKRIKVYLAGAMEHAPDGGAGWREKISEFLITELHHQVFNPCIEEGKLLTPEEILNFRKWKTNDLPRFRNTINKIIRNDLDTLLNEIDYIICFWDNYVLNGGGTHGELTMACYHHIPIYMVSDIPRKDVSSWILGCTSELFENFESLKAFLRIKYSK